MSIADLRFQAITDAPLQSCILTLFWWLPGFLIQRSGASSRDEHHANDQPRDRPADVDQDIAECCRARGHKRLMKFICGGEHRTRNPDQNKQDRHLHLDVRSVTSRAPKHHRQNRILTQVRGFSSEELDLRDRGRRNIRFQPAQQRNKKTRSLFGGKRISRACENQTEPDQNRHPIFEKGSHAVVAGVSPAN